MLVLVEAIGREPVRADGEDVIMKFALPTGGRVVAQRARICWVKDARGRAAFGVEFHEPDPATLTAIATYVRLIGSIAA
mgnify:CR=1 FL=1